MPEQELSEAREALEAAAESPDTPQPEALNAVLLLRRRDGDSISIDVQCIGDVLITEAQTILALAQRQVKEKLGI